MTVSHFAVVPVRSFESGKKRLRRALGDEARAGLVRDMAAHVVGTLVPMLTTAVVSRDPQVLAFAEELGAIPIRESGRPAPSTGLDDPLNEALNDAAEVAATIDAKVLAVVAGDLPLLARDDVAALLRLPGRPGVVLAADRTGNGTNALVVSPRFAVPFLFGPGSLAAHRTAAFRRGVRVRVLRRPGLQHDVDRPEDLPERFRPAGADGTLP